MMHANIRGAGRSSDRGAAGIGAFMLEAALVIVLAYVAASFVWTLLAPSSLAPPAARAAVAPSVSPSFDYRPQTGGFNLFRPGAFGAAAPAGGPEIDAPVSTLNLTVTGARLSTADGGGSAIIATPNGAQRVYRAGEEIVDGVSMHRVEATRVLLDRQGQIEAIPFATRELAVLDGGAARRADGAAARPDDRPPTRVDGAELLRSIAPRSAPDNRDGVAVYPVGEGVAFAAAGFEPGDVVRSVNGRSIDSAERVREVLSTVGPGNAVEVVVDRAGARVAVEFVAEG